MTPWKKTLIAVAFALAAPLWAADQVAGPLIGSGTTKAGPQLVASAQVLTDKGIVEGKTSADNQIRIFLGIPYAAPPVGELRWKAPQPAQPWTGIFRATQFGHRPMQGHIWDDMIFYDPGPSEDCLTLNVWTPVKSVDQKLPVMAWIYGGGFIAGGTSEKRQEGENLARKGVVVVTFNYRLGVFGFLAHPDLTKEAGGSSGNYGLMDQVAALKWIQKNIASFGGDPDNVTIFGESAGSFSVSALMASPMAKGLFKRAIGESGALFGARRWVKPLAKAEEEGVEFAKSVGASSLKDLRARGAEGLLNAKWKTTPFYFGADIDGALLPGDPETIYAAGKQAHVPLLAGWNADEGGYRSVLKDGLVTPENFVKMAGEQFGDRADDFLKLYPAKTAEEIKRAAGDLAGDQFIAFGTWKWMEAHRKTGQQPVFRYEFDDSLPQPPGQESRGAYHSAEIEFVFGDLASKKLPWRPEDWKLSGLMMDYWSNFAKTGDPNGPGLPEWPVYKAKTGYQVMHLSAGPKAEPDRHRARYLFLEKVESKK